MGAKIRAILLIAFTSAFAFFVSAAPANADTVIRNPGVVITFSDGVLVNGGTEIRMSFTLSCHVATGDPAIDFSGFGVSQTLKNGDVATGGAFVGSDGQVACDTYTRDALVSTFTVPFTHGKADVSMTYQICDTDSGQCQPREFVDTQIKIKKK